MNPKKRALRVRVKLKSNSDGSRLRLSVFKSLKHIGVQAIDDVNGFTVVSYGSDLKEVREKSLKGVELAKFVGEQIAKKVLATGKDKVFFDRGAYNYHGKIRALAEAARNSGLKF